MGFMDYKTYDTSSGFGNSSEWRKALNYRMNGEKARQIIKEASPYEILGLVFGATRSEIKKQFIRARTISIVLACIYCS